MHQKTVLGQEESLWDKGHGREERATRVGKAACPVTLGVPSHILLLTGEKGCGLQEVCKPSLGEAGATLSSQDFPSMPQSNHRVRDRLPFLEMSFMGGGLSALTNDFHCSLCYQVTGS